MIPFCFHNWNRNGLLLITKSELDQMGESLPGTRSCFQIVLALHQAIEVAEIPILLKQLSFYNGFTCGKSLIQTSPHSDCSITMSGAVFVADQFTS